jgi:hypothetical protein
MGRAISVAGRRQFRANVFNSDVFGKVLDCFDRKEKQKLREVSARLADDLVPRSFAYCKYELGEDAEDKEYHVLKRFRYARKMEIRNICGTEAHLRKIEEIGKN